MLVERIINKIINEKIDIDKLLVVTFTNAAATEMRERVLKALYKELDKNPQDANLQKQILLLNKASISTIHAFCLDVIKNNFYQKDISPNFRLATPQEVELIKMEVLEDLFDTLYEEKNKEFIKLVNVYGGYRDDENLKEIVLKIYKYIQSTPFPEEWLENQIEKFNIKDMESDFSNTEWGEILIKNLKDDINSSIDALKNIAKKISVEEELQKHYLCLLEDIQMLEEVINLEKWDDIYNSVLDLKFKTWPINRKAVLEIKDQAKEIRDKVKKDINKYKERIFIYNSQQANSDIYAMYEILAGIKKLILDFSEKYSEAKRERNVIDFNDIEHYALNILTEKNKDGEYVPTDVAKKYQEKYEEIAIDEYQDSNLVQEYILKAVSRGNNIFMVGDVKQSIYKFRQARPELFLDKYNKYAPIEEKRDKDRKIQLFENFRSRKNILDFTNMVFEDIMSKELGDIEYDQKECLNQGMEYEKPEDNIEIAQKLEIHIIDLADNEDEEKSETKESEQSDEEEIELVDNIEIEAKFVANKIKEILNSNLNVWDKNLGYRKVTFKDIAILLRSTATTAPIYERELMNLEFSVFCDTSTNYFESLEIQTIINLLKIVDNPNNDIPLVAVLRSPIVGMSDNELVEIRTIERNTSFFDAITKAKTQIKNDEIKRKIDKFYLLLNDLQEKQEYLKLDELLWYIYEITGYYNYVSLLPNGNVKTANLKMLFEKAKDYEEGSFKGLYNFINFIDRVTKSNGDMGAPKLIGENENVIRIMSIHKSKGLEFPIVFLCGTGKQFNMQDLNQEILMHQDYGFGPQYINYERRIEYNTLAKEAIKMQTKTELLSEEMRLLYVALTRAREKLIVTGVDKNLKKSIKTKTQALESVKQENKIDKSIVKTAKSYLDWLELVTIYDKRKNDILDIFEHKKKEINLARDEIKTQEVKIKDVKEIPEEIEDTLNWTYSNSELTKIEGKTSVSKIAHEDTPRYEVEAIKPKFLENERKLSKTEIGTTIHLIMQKLNVQEDYDEEKVNKLLEELVYKNIILNSQKEAVDVSKILKFTKSKIFTMLKTAKKIYREQPFYINLTADEIYRNGIQENILVQGIIDLYFIDENDNVILVDYKTDYVPNNDENYLIQKYKEQLNLYAKALEQALNKHVEEIYIYSTYMNKEIKCAR